MSKIEPHFVLTNCNINIITGIKKRKTRTNKIKECKIEITGIVIQNTVTESLLIKELETKYLINNGEKILNYIYEKMNYSFTNLSIKLDFDSLFSSKDFNKIKGDGCKITITKVNNISYNNISLLKIIKDKNLRLWMVKGKKISELINNYDNKVDIMLPENFLQSFWKIILENQMIGINEKTIINTSNIKPIKKRKIEKVIEFMGDISNEKPEEITSLSNIINDEIKSNKNEVIDKLGDLEIRQDNSTEIEAKDKEGKEKNKEKRTRKLDKESSSNLITRLKKMKKEQENKNKLKKEVVDLKKKKDLNKTSNPLCVSNIPIIQRQRKNLNNKIDKKKDEYYLKTPIIKNYDTSNNNNNKILENNNNKIFMKSVLKNINKEIIDKNILEVINPDTKKIEISYPKIPPEEENNEKDIVTQKIKSEKLSDFQKKTQKKNKKKKPFF